MRDQGQDDVIVGGAGDDTLAGGQMSDLFVFNQTDTGADVVLDAENWDTFYFEGFGYNSNADVLAHMTDIGGSAVFSDQGVEVTFVGIMVADFTGNMLLV